MPGPRQSRQRVRVRARDAFTAAGLQAADGERGTLRSLAIRVGCRTREIMATLIVIDDRDRRVRSATRRLLDQAPPTSMHLNVHAREDAFIFGPSTRHLHGSTRMREEVAGASSLLSPAAFFQTNVLAADILVRLVLDAVPPSSRVLDLYAGSGRRHSACRGRTRRRRRRRKPPRCRRWRGRVEAQRRGSGACRFIGRRVEAALPSLRAAGVVMLDPPREGCSPPVLREVFGRLRPATAVYVSCNPEALASDTGSDLPQPATRSASIQPVWTCFPILHTLKRSSRSGAQIRAK